MTIEQLVPRAGTVELAELVERLASPVGPALPPFSEEALTFCAQLSEALFADRSNQRYPQLVALAFALRPAELGRLTQAYQALQTTDTLLVPRGLVFHIPPANVDTVFVYSWLYSFLAANRNVIRLPRERTEPMQRLYDTFARLMAAAAHPAIQTNTVMVSYGHEPEINAALSGRCDLRVIWGGDGTVAELRKIPLPPHARELTFADRRSMAALSAPAFLALGDEARIKLGEAFYNDAFWFDQMGCSSPRVVVWCGPDEARIAAARAFQEVAQRAISAKGYRVDTGTALAKLTYAYREVLDRPLTAVARISNELFLLPISELPRDGREHPGGGLFYQYGTGALDDIAPFIDRRDQTLAHFGFTPQQLLGFARLLNGRGLDRLVPFGDALRFHRYWDGCDLLAEMLRRVHIVPSLG